MSVSLCIWFLLTLSLSAVECHVYRYSQPLDSIDGFVPIHNHADLNVNGQIREFPKDNNQSVTQNNLTNQSNLQLEDSSTNNSTDAEDDVIVNELFMEIRNLQEYFFNLFDNILSKDSDSYEIASGIRIEAVNNSTKNSSTTEVQSRSLSNLLGEGATTTDIFLENIRDFVKQHDLRVNMPRAMESGRLFFFSGMYSIKFSVYRLFQSLKLSS